MVSKIFAAYIFIQCLGAGRFPFERKKSNLVPVHKQGQRQLLRNYQLVSLHLICIKIIQRLLFNKRIRFFYQEQFDFLKPILFQARKLLYFPVFISPTKYIILLVTSLRWEVLFSKLQNHIIDFGTRVLSSSGRSQITLSSKTEVCQKSWQCYYRHVFIICT